MIFIGVCAYGKLEVCVNLIPIFMYQFVMVCLKKLISNFIEFIHFNSNEFLCFKMVNTSKLVLDNVQEFRQWYVGPPLVSTIVQTSFIYFMHFHLAVNFWCLIIIIVILLIISNSKIIIGSFNPFAATD